MFFISDKAVITTSQIAILEVLTPSSTLTNTSEYPATIEGSHNGRDFSLITILQGNQSKRLPLPFKYIRIMGDNTKIYMDNHFPEFSPKPNLVEPNKVVKINEDISIETVKLLNASGSKPIATLATLEK